MILIRIETAHRVIVHSTAENATVSIYSRTVSSYKICFRANHRMMTAAGYFYNMAVELPAQFSNNLDPISRVVILFKAPASLPAHPISCSSIQFPKRASQVFE
jgi:hypothetical protein